MKRTSTGLERCHLILDSKTEWEFWVLGENIICMWKECEWLLPEGRKRETAKMITIFHLLRNGVSSTPWICTGHVTGLSQQETGKWEAWVNLESICTWCFWNILLPCKRDQVRLLYERVHVAQWSLLLSHHLVNLLKQIYWADQKLTTDE